MSNEECSEVSGDTSREVPAKITSPYRFSGCATMKFSITDLAFARREMVIFPSVISRASILADTSRSHIQSIHSVDDEEFFISHAGSRMERLSNIRTRTRLAILIVRIFLFVV